MSQTTVFDRDSHPAEQFEDAAQQAYASMLGMWAFLATEVLFIGAVFTGFYVYRSLWPIGFSEGARELKWYLAVINTAVLLSSSYTMALAVHAARHDLQTRLRQMLLATLALGSLFLLIKFGEYAIEYHDQLIPGLNYRDVSQAGTPRPLEMKLFMTFYFTITAIHATHMIVGVVILGVMFRKASSGVFTSAYHHPIEVVGLYWHFVDLVWVFVLPTLYLLRHP